MRCSIVPPYLLARLAQLDDPLFARTAVAAQRSLRLDEPMRSIRTGEVPPPAGPGALRQQSVATVTIEAVRRTIASAGNTEQLPGTVVRREGEAATSDPAVTEAYDGLGHTHDFFAKAYGRASIDNDNLPLDASVHYGVDYDNAFWNGERMVFGDGDGQVFTRMTRSLTVIGHELTHGVTQYSANLDYSGQSGALNESVSDVFGALVEQYTLKQTAQTASWLIGAGIFTEAVQGTALRSMKAPGTAYDDNVLGKDPQPDSMDGYVTTRTDSGGVHLNSGIPNRAFYLAADTIGGHAWESVGQVWYDTLIGGTLKPGADFAAFARATIAAAGARYGATSAEVDAVTAGWTTVKVL
ncbi:MAG: peptidase family protein [Glaciihabitans sp.]|nr:peptidase family protein [Glaciihabitans sp.]